MSEPSDGDLITRSRSGDEQALDLLFTRYEGPVFRFLYGVLKNHHQAEDALQETFVQALRHAESLQPATFRGWLFTVAHRQAMLLKRKEKRVPLQASDLLLLDQPDRSRRDAAAGGDDAGRLRELMDLLPAPQRAVIAARIFEGKTFREAAAALGCPVNTALSRMHEGLKKLRQLWEARYV